MQFENYNPLKTGYSFPNPPNLFHDRALLKASNKKCRKILLIFVIILDNPPENLHSSKKKTLFISKLPSNINEEQLQEKFSKYGKIRSLNLIKDLITGENKGYGFLEYKHFDDAFYVYRKFRKNKQKINTNEIQIDFERARNQKGWKPRRLGGGVGGNKRSGQLRFT